MRRKMFIITVILLVSAVAAVQAQDGLCPTIVEEALKSVDSVCGALDRNAACYGSTLVNSTPVAQPPPANFFTVPGDNAQLNAFREIYPQPLDENKGTFGVAVLNVQAKLPDTLPGQAVIFLLMGDARLTNEVPADSDQQTPFQSFYFLPNIGKEGCYEAEPMLVIQTPGNITTTITLNGVKTEMSPSTLLTITASVCTIHRGFITQRVGDKTANLLANQTVDIHIEQNGTVVVDDLRGISQREYDRGLKVQDALNGLSEANGWADQFVGAAPPTFDSEPVKPAATPEASPSSATCKEQYTVVPGDTLAKIAQRFGTTVQALVTANQIVNPNIISPGQVLCIPASSAAYTPPTTRGYTVRSNNLYGLFNPFGFYGLPLFWPWINY
jgi:LysM repeat protein